MKNRLSILLTLTLMTLMTSSCITARRVNYLQDMAHKSQIVLEDHFEARIAPADEISIFVSCPHPELAAPFNVYYGTNLSQNGTQRGYLVDVNGDIQFPILGNLHVAGMTRLELQDSLSDVLLREGYLESPYVMVRFNNFKIFVLGNGTGKVLNITNERCTFLEALAIMGGLDNFTRRDRIGVMREVNGRMVLRFLDPRSSKVFRDPFFMLQQNDFIIIDNINSGTLRNEFAYWSGWLSTLMSTASLVTTILLYRSLSNGNKQ